VLEIMFNNRTMHGMFEKVSGVCEDTPSNSCRPTKIFVVVKATTVDKLVLDHTASW